MPINIKLPCFSRKKLFSSGIQDKAKKLGVALLGYSPTSYLPNPIP